MDSHESFKSEGLIIKSAFSTEEETILFFFFHIFAFGPFQILHLTRLELTVPRPWGIKPFPSTFSRRRYLISFLINFKYPTQNDTALLPVYS